MNDSPFLDTLLKYSVTASTGDTLSVPRMDNAPVVVQVNNSLLVDTLVSSTATWSFFLMMVVMGILFYLFLLFLSQRISRLSLTFKAEDRWSNYLRQVLLLYELFFVVVMGSLFILLNPPWHGLIVFFLVLITFPLLRNYLIGRLLCFDRDFGTGKRISIGASKGVINHMNRLGIYVNTNDGMQYFNYKQLQKEGFSIVTDSSMEEYCDLNITVSEEHPTNGQQLLYQLMGVPYLDSGYKPILIQSEANTIFRIRVLIRKGNHRRELVQLIEGWGYQCQFSH
ncbi:MAG: hypothetical protein ACRBFS_02430 [Aureispira sp.]